MACTHFPVSPFLPAHARDLPERTNTHRPVPGARISFQTHPLAPATRLTGIPRHGSPDGRRARVLQSRSQSSWRTSWLPVLTRVSKRFSAAAQLTLYRALELSADDARAARLALALRYMRALSSLTLPAFDAELLAAAPGTLTHLALPHFAGVPPCSA